MNRPDSDQWQADFQRYHPAFSGLGASATLFADHQIWPTLEDYQTVLAAPPTVCNHHGQPLTVMAQSHSALHYELAIDHAGELHTRCHCWHDFFQILVWRRWPHSKAALSAVHATATTARLANNLAARSPIENACTLFDENGALLLTSAPQLVELARNFAWRDLFVTQRAAWNEQIQCIVFGHALYEKLLQPYIGLTAHALLMVVPGDFWRWPATQQTTYIDDALTAMLQRPETLHSPRALQPLPLLGIPGWHADNHDERFYDNRDYFRPGRVIRNIASQTKPMPPPRMPPP